MGYEIGTLTSSPSDYCLDKRGMSTFKLHNKQVLMLTTLRYIVSADIPGLRVRAAVQAGVDICVQSAVDLNGRYALPRKSGLEAE